MLATELPQILSPLIQQIPETLTDPETRALHPHIDTLVNQEPRDVIILKHLIERRIESFLENDGFIGVNTPLLEARAGGAIARPFETRATEFPNTPISLRIAPELYLKRLVIGGFDKLYEMGPAFRNEGRGYPLLLDRQFTKLQSIQVSMRLTTPSSPSASSTRHSPRSRI